MIFKNHQQFTNSGSKNKSPDLEPTSETKELIECQ